MNETQCPKCGETLQLEYERLGEPEYSVLELTRIYCPCGYEE
jgi:C4-type Zn-finger protein